MHAEKVAYVERGGRVWKFGIRREKLKKTTNTSVTFFKNLNEIIN
jgi:uncharacterized protein (DUF2249 family)